MPAKRPAKKKATAKRRGPKPETLALEGDWEKAVGDALKKPSSAPGTVRKEGQRK